MQFPGRLRSITQAILAAEPSTSWAASSLASCPAIGAMPYINAIRGDGLNPGL